jgi:cell division protein FtsB
MGIALVIVGGCVLISVVASAFDFLGKRKGRDDKAIEERLSLLEAKLKELNQEQMEKTEKIAKLETEMSFMNNLIEDRTNH